MLPTLPRCALCLVVSNVVSNQVLACTEASPPVRGILSHRAAFVSILLGYGRITAIDLNTGEHLWMRPIGDGPRDHPALQHLKLPQLGWPYRSFVLLTESLLFVAQEGQVTGVRGISPTGNAIDLET
jgi:hypothetical protein